MIKYPSPILIAAPVRRSGTTLLQRLLCSASNTLIFGETCANELKMFATLYNMKRGMFSMGKEDRDYQLEQVLNGEVNDWIPELMPKMDEFLPAIERSYLSLFNYLEDYSKQKQRPVWGVKLPEWDTPSLFQTLQWLPESKLIYIWRNLESCLKSAKAADIVRSLPEMTQFAQIWQYFLNQIKAQEHHPRILIINYSELIQSAKTILPQIEAFTGAKGIQASVLNHKVNDFKGADKTQSFDSNYILPAELSEEEKALVKQFTVT